MAEDLEDDFDDDEGGGGEGEKSSKGPDLKKLILLVVLPLLLVIGAVAGVYFSGLADPVLKMFSGAPKEEKDAVQVPISMAVFYDLPDMLVNLNSTSKKQSYLKIKVSLELNGQPDVQRVEQVLPRIIDNFQVYLRELRVEDMQGAAGMYRLREELLARVNAIVRPAKVGDVLFREMLIQ